MSMNNTTFADFTVLFGQHTRKLDDTKADNNINNCIKKCKTM